MLAYINCKNDWVLFKVMGLILQNLNGEGCMISYFKLRKYLKNFLKDRRKPGKSVSIWQVAAP